MIEPVMTQSPFMPKLDLQAIETMESSEGVSSPKSRNQLFLPIISDKASLRFLDPRSPKPRSQKAGIPVATPKRQQEDKISEADKEIRKTSVATNKMKKRMRTNAFFQENADLFEEKLDPKALRYLCEKAVLEAFNKNEIIYEKEQRSNGKIYLIYKGEVGLIYQPKELGTFSDEVDKFNYSQYGRLIDLRRSVKLLPKIARKPFLHNQNEDDTTTDSTENSPTCEKKKKQINPYLGLVVSRILRSQEYFGGEVLLDKERREDTAIAKTDIEVLAIKSEDLEYVKYRYEKRRVENFNSLLESLSLSYGTEEENQLFELLTERTFASGEVVLSEGGTGKFIYFLCKGRCEIQKKSHESLPAKKANFRRNATVGVIGDGTFIGEEIIFGNTPNYGYTVRVASPRAEFFVIDSSVLLEILDKEKIALISQRYTKKVQKCQAIFEAFSQEFSKIGGEVSLTPNHKSNTPLFPEFEPSWKDFNLPKASLKKIFGLQADCDRVQSPSANVHFAKRKSIKLLCHQLVSPKQLKGEAEISPNGQPELLYRGSPPKNLLKEEKVNFVGQKTDFQNGFVRANTFNIREIDNRYEAYSTGLLSKSPTNSEKSPVHEKLVPGFGEKKKKSKFSSNLKEIFASDLKEQTKKKYEVLQAMIKRRKNREYEKTERQTENFEQLFVESCLNASINRSYTARETSPKYNFQINIPELEDDIKESQNKQKPVPLKKENLKEGQFCLKKVNSKTLKPGIALKKLSKEGNIFEKKTMHDFSFCN